MTDRGCNRHLLVGGIEYYVQVVRKEMGNMEKCRYMRVGDVRVDVHGDQ